jgi:hypothetical protein
MDAAESWARSRAIEEVELHTWEFPKDPLRILRATRLPDDRANAGTQEHAGLTLTRWPRRTTLRANQPVVAANRYVI